MSREQGNSDISAPKHDALRYLLDIEVSAIHGQLWREGPRMTTKEVVWHDLMSGAGVCDHVKSGKVRDFHLGCSPGIFLSRAEILSRQIPNLPITVNLNEMSRINLGKLRACLAEELPGRGWKASTSPDVWWYGENVRCILRRGDSRKVDLSLHTRETAVFINQDPNVWTQLVVPEGYANRANYWQTTFFVLGMNASGVGRLQTSTHPSHKDVWLDRYEQLNFLATRRAHHQDVVVLEPRTSSGKVTKGHWVYLLITARSAVNRSMEKMRKAFERYGYEIEMCSHDQNRERFEEIMWGLL